MPARVTAGSGSQSRCSSQGTLGASVSPSVRWTRELVRCDGLYGSLSSTSEWLRLDLTPRGCSWQRDPAAQPG